MAENLAGIERPSLQACAPIWVQDSGTAASSAMRAWADLDILVWDIARKSIYLPQMLNGWLSGRYEQTFISTVAFAAHLDPASRRDFELLISCAEQGQPLAGEITLRHKHPGERIDALTIKTVQLLDNHHRPDRVIGLLSGVDIASLDNFRINLQHRALAALSNDAKLYGDDGQAAMQAIASTLASLLGCSRIGIWFFSEQDTVLECAELYELDSDQHSCGMRLERSDYPSYFAALMQSNIVVADDARTDLRTCEFRAGYLEPLDIYSMMDVLIHYNAEEIGVICCEQVGAPRQWRTDEKVFATSLAAMLSVHLEARERRRAERALLDQQTRYQVLFDSATDAIMLLDANGVITDCNAFGNTLFESCHGSMIGHNFYALLPERLTGASASPLSLREHIRTSLGEGGRRSFEWQFVDSREQMRAIEIGVMSVFIYAQPMLFVTIRDIGEKKTYLATIEHQISHDSLTDLPNRNSLRQMIDVRLSSTNRSDHIFALLVVNVSHFKEINDTFGHDVGDELLRQVSQRLLSVMRHVDATMARFEGDEFGIIVNHVVNEEQAQRICAWINKTLEPPFVLPTAKLQIAVRIGIAFCPRDARDTDELLRCGDFAMREAQRIGRSLNCYSPHLEERQPKQLALMSELRSALGTEDLFLHYQPKVELESKCICGFEALVRWRHSNLGLISPGTFIPLAEMSDMIRPLTYQVLDMALAQWQHWAQQGTNTLIAVNLSTRNLLDEDCAEQIQELLARYRVPANFLELEITESSLIADPDRAMQNVSLLHKLGINMAIDDFGTGYSSLGYLKSLPVSTLKIDMSFIRNMVSDTSDYKIVQSTINLAHSLGMTVVAEGAADETTTIMLRAMGCNFVQGEFYSMPVDVDRISIKEGRFHVNERVY